MKNIFHLATDVSLASGGQRTAVTNLNDYLNSTDDFESFILTNHKEEKDNFTEFRPRMVGFWSYTPDIKWYIEENSRKIDILHLHGVWLHTQYIGFKMSKKHDIPSVLTPHGMLQPWYLKTKKFKKKLYLDFILKEILKGTTALHSITPLETSHLYSLSRHTNIVEIPNLLHFSNIPDDIKYEPEENYLLYLSRIHPGKGLDILFNAIAKIDNKKIKLKIVGLENSYSEKLKKHAEKLSILHRIEFTGAVFGAEKWKIFANAKAFVAPSYSEAIGMVNLEAAACKTPVITTYNTGIHDDWNKNGGILINPIEHELIEAINTITSWNELERIDRGKQLADFANKNYSWEQKGYLWNQLYDNL